MSAAAPAAAAGTLPRRVDPAFVVHTGPRRDHLDLLVPEMHCAGCMGKIERGLVALPGIAHARANLTTRRVATDYDPAHIEPETILAAVEGLGYDARPFDAAALEAAGADAAGAELLRSLAVAGFAAGNVMLLSIAVWAGAEAATREMFHWLSALIALPAIAYSIRPFLRSAVRAVAAGQLNMDAPIVVAVALTAALSLYETMVGGRNAYFEAAVGLPFFLLVGRYLDHRMREVARSAAGRLMALGARSAMRLSVDGTACHVPIGDIVPGDRVAVAAGERVPVDGRVVEGVSDVDRAMLTGEPEPENVASGDEVHAGTMNLTGPLTVEATAPASASLLADIVRLMEAAERGRGRFVRLAERAARIYAPVVHLLALVTFAGWMAAGSSWHASLTAAVAVLIITCPCALGLAVPAVQVVASGRLLREGIMVKDGSALERLAGVGTVVLDKTGTLSVGAPRLVEVPDASAQDWAVAAALGRASRHPAAKALAAAAEARGAEPAAVTDIEEVPGRGLQGRLGAAPVRLGRGDWVGGRAASGGSEIFLKVGERSPLRFGLADELRADAAATVARLRDLGLAVRLVSGDRPEAVAEAAGRAGIDDWRAGVLPADKAQHLAELADGGRRVLMVGDGINDGPALAVADASMAPASGSDISQAAADIVFTGPQLAPVTTALDTARAARRLILQNIALSVGYNLVAVPMAVAGLVTPPVAAIAMSSSSILVTANALRLALGARRRSAEPKASNVTAEATA